MKPSDAIPVAIPVGTIPVVQTTDRLKDAQTDASPLARVWIYIWTFMTWVFTFAFAVLLMVVYKTQVGGTGFEHTRYVLTLANTHDQKPN